MRVCMCGVCDMCVHACMCGMFGVFMCGVHVVCEWYICAWWYGMCVMAVLVQERVHATCICMCI